MVIYNLPEVIRHPRAQRSEVFRDILDISSFKENIQMWMEEIAGTGMIAIFAPLRAAVFAIAEPMVAAESFFNSEIRFKLSQDFETEIP